MSGLISDTIRIVPGGTINGTQTWSTSIWMSLGALGTTVTQSQLDTIAGQVKTSTDAWASAIAGNFWESDTQYNSLKVYWYPANQVRSALVSIPAAATATGSSAGSSLPAYVSAAVSLRSDTPGRSGRGRSYVPITKATLTSHLLTSSMCSQIGSAYKTWLQALNALTFSIPPGGNNKVQVASFSKSLCYTVTHISVDNVPDTQHRRTDKFLRQTLYASTI